jgi:hypothetical protein
MARALSCLMQLPAWSRCCIKPAARLNPRPLERPAAAPTQRRRRRQAPPCTRRAARHCAPRCPKQPSIQASITHAHVKFVAALAKPRRRPPLEQWAARPAPRTPTQPPNQPAPQHVRAGGSPKAALHQLADGSTCVRPVVGHPVFSGPKLAPQPQHLSTPVSLASAPSTLHSPVLPPSYTPSLHLVPFWCGTPPVPRVPRSTHCCCLCTHTPPI